MFIYSGNVILLKKRLIKMGIGEVFSRSWEITKICFNVIKQDKEILIFPILSSILSIIFIILMIIPLFIGNYLNGIIMYIVLFILYLGLAFIGTFFNVAVINTAKKRFEGGNASFFDSIGAAFTKIHLIFLWSIVSATVGIILQIIRDIAKNLKGVGEIILEIIDKILGLVWNIATIFVLQGIVYEDIGPFKAIKRSVEVLKKTWGESLIRYYGLGFVEGLLIIFGIIIGVILIIIGVLSGSLILIIVLVILIVIYLTLVVLIFGVANTIFNTALYVYAVTGKIPGGFNKDIMRDSFKKKEQKTTQKII
jgi:hypothetical protein